ncbi:MAG TPA: fused MFS/spermidine synthase [Myxococcota bacterium]|nr:fused MFS/spermidine synthase [Myxococcota bacterium]
MRVTALDPAAPIVSDRALTSRVPYAITIFLGAFLLFQIQPLMGKFIIPWYGGLPSAWTGCLIFFQGGLLAGYLYAHLLVRHLAPRTQAILHTALLVSGLVLLPIAPSSAWKPAPGTHSMGGIFLLLGATIGLPYLLLASTGPMTQAWFHRSFPTGSPYRLFALSNLGSMLGLVSYPFLFEPWLTRTSQGWLWSAGFAVFIVSCAACAFSSAGGAARREESPAVLPALSDRPAAMMRFLWVALPACASLLLLSVTNQLCQGMPSVPFLWVLPLAIYLSTFIVCFEWPQLYSRWAFLAAMALSLAGVCYLLRLDTSATARLQIAGFSGALFVCCMACHGELALAKPDPRHLTAFYLAVSAGGALGGAFVGLAAPHLFSGFYELHWGFFLCPVLVLLSLFAQPGSPLHRGKPVWAWVALAAAVVGLGVDLRQRYQQSLTYTVASTRDFFGVLRLFEAPSRNPRGKVRLLGHGGIIHGFQWIEPAYWNTVKTSYFGPGTGLGDAFRLLAPRRPLRVGVVGLGIGTVAAWGQEGDHFRFYEINPSVVRIAYQNFTYLRDTRAQVEIVEGDGRLALEAEPDQGFDLLVLDAFNGDSPPIHLMTADAFRVYRRHLAPDGLLAVNISNKFLDFEQVVRSVGGAAGMDAIRIDSAYDLDIGIAGAIWMLLAPQPGLLAPLAEKASPAPAEPPRTAMWTDDYANVLSIVR